MIQATPYDFFYYWFSKFLVSIACMRFVQNRVKLQSHIERIKINLPNMLDTLRWPKLHSRREQYCCIAVYNYIKGVIEDNKIVK